MKKIIFLLTLFLSFSTYCQFGNGMNQRQQRQRQMTQTQRPAPKPNYDVEKYLGIVIYEIEKAAKKSSIKLDSDEGKEFQTILKKYNKEVNDFRRINSFTLRTTKEMVESFQKKAQENKSGAGGDKVFKKMTEDLKPISETLKAKDIVLDKKLKTLLSKKQYKKWLKYNRKLYKFFPKDEEK